MNLTNKTAVVTGSATSIGQGIALALAQHGANVVVVYNRTPADETMQLIKEVGGKAIAVQADVANREDIKNIFTKANTAFGGVNILINNAALQLNHCLMEYTEEEYDRLMSVNLKAYWRCIQESMSCLKSSGNGRIINVASVHSKRPTGFDVVYSMTKGGIKMLTREAAIALSPYKITVNMLSLGAIKVPSRSGNPKWKCAPDLPTNSTPMSPFLSGRMGIPADVGNLAVFLASDESIYINGSSIRADGGAMLV